MAETVHIDVPQGQWVKIVDQNVRYSFRVSDEDIIQVTIGGLSAPNDAAEVPAFLVENVELRPQQGIHFGEMGAGEAIWARGLREDSEVHVALFSPIPVAVVTPVTPNATGDGAVVAPGPGMLYGAEIPLDSPAVTLLDDGELFAILTPGVPMDFSSRPRRFLGPLTALSVSALGATAILLDLVLD